MSMYAASNISRAVNQFKSRGYAKLRGLILNAKNVEKEKELVDKLCEEIDTSVFHYVPRNSLVQESENTGKTVVEAFPDSDMSKIYVDLAKKIMEA